MAGDNIRAPPESKARMQGGHRWGTTSRHHWNRRLGCKEGNNGGPHRGTIRIRGLNVRRAVVGDEVRACWNSRLGCKDFSINYGDSTFFYLVLPLKFSTFYNGSHHHLLLGLIDTCAIFNFFPSFLDQKSQDLISSQEIRDFFPQKRGLMEAF